MKALSLEKIGELRFVETDKPGASLENVLIRVSHCALCRTDAKMWQQGHRDLIMPRILGHEVCGYLEGTQERYVVWPGDSCGKCFQCQKGEENLCREMRILGFHRNGGLSEWMVAPKTSLIPVPENLPSPEVCLAEPLACAINALDQANVSANENVLIYGGGTLGLMLAMAAQARGAKPFIKEKSKRKLRRSADFRESLNIDGSTEHIKNHYDAAINAAPVVDTLTDALTRLIPGGRFCLFSGLTGNHSIPVRALNEVHYRQLRMVGAYGCTRQQMRQALNLMTHYPGVTKELIDEEIKPENVLKKFPEVLSGKFFKFVVTFE